MKIQKNNPMLDDPQFSSMPPSRRKHRNKKIHKPSSGDSNCLKTSAWAVTFFLGLAVGGFICFFEIDQNHH